MSAPNRNATSARLVFAAWSTGDIERLDTVVAAEVVHRMDMLGFLRQTGAMSKRGETTQSPA